MEDFEELCDLVDLLILHQIGDLDDRERARARAWADGFEFLPLRAFVTQMSAAIDLVHAWTALNAPFLAPPTGKIVPMAPYRYRAQFVG